MKLYLIIILFLVSAFSTLTEVTISDIDTSLTSMDRSITCSIVTSMKNVFHAEVTSTLTFQSDLIHPIDILLSYNISQSFYFDNHDDVHIRSSNNTYHPSQSWTSGCSTNAEDLVFDDKTSCPDAYQSLNIEIINISLPVNVEGRIVVAIPVHGHYHQTTFDMHDTTSPGVSEPDIFIRDASFPAMDSDVSIAPQQSSYVKLNCMKDVNGMMLLHPMRGSMGHYVIVSILSFAILLSSILYLLSAIVHVSSTN